MGQILFQAFLCWFVLGLFRIIQLMFNSSNSNYIKQWPNYQFIRLILIANEFKLNSLQQKPANKNTFMSLDKSYARDRDNNPMNRSIYNSKVMMGFSSVLNSPTNAQRQLHLRKSRIVNIPSNKKQNLSQKLQFVVVFQTIQIQRLSEQLQTLSALVHDYERKVFNIDNYEIQIKELTQKCYRLQNQRNQLREELAQNKDVSQNIYRELEDIKKRYLGVDFTSSEKYKSQKSRNEQLLSQIQKWKSRYQAIDQSKSNELNSIKNLMEEQKRTLLTRQTKQLFQRFQSQKQSLQHKNKQLKRIIQQKQNELKKTKNFLTVLQKQRQNDQKQLQQYEQKVALLSQQNYRLSQMIKMKQNQLKKTRIQIDSSMNLKMSQINSKQQEKSMLNTKIQRIHKQLQQKQQKINQLQRINLQNKTKLSEKERLQFILTETKQQINGKNKLLQRKDKKIFNLQEELAYMTKMTQDIKILKTQNIQMKQQILIMLQKIQKQINFIKIIKKSFSQKIQSIAAHYKTMQEQMAQNLKKAFDFSQALTKQIQEDRQYITQIQASYSKSKKTIQSLQQEKLQKIRVVQEKKIFQRQNAQKDNQIKILKKKVHQLLQQKNTVANFTLGQQQKFKIQQEKLKKQVQVYKGKDLSNIQIIQNLNMKVNSSNEYISQEKYKNSQILKQIQSLNKIIREKQNDAQYLLERLNLFKKSQTDLKVQIQTVLKRVEAIQAKILSLRNFFDTTYQKQKIIYDSNKRLQENCKNLVEEYLNLSQKHSKLYQILLDVNSSSNSSNLDINSIRSLNSQNLSKTVRFNDENINNSNFRDLNPKLKVGVEHNHNQKQIPIEFMIRYILIAAQVQSLRQKVGDKNAKIQTIKNNLKLSSASNSKGKQSFVRTNKLMQNQLGCLNYDGNKLIRKVTSHQRLDESSVLQVDISSTDKSGIYTSKRGSLGKGIFKGISIKKSTYN